MGFTANAWGSPGYGGDGGGPGGGSPVDPAPVTIALSNGWTAAEPATYQRFISGVVELCGLIVPGTRTIGTVLFTLPTGRRPLADLILDTPTDLDDVRIKIAASTGQVTINAVIGGTLEYIYFGGSGPNDGLEFSAV